MTIVINRQKLCNNYLVENVVVLIYMYIDVM